MLFLTFFRYESLKKKIDRKYDETERTLIDQFVVAQRKEDLNRMKEIADVLSQFKGYSHCIDAFIEQSQSVSTACSNY